MLFFLWHGPPYCIRSYGIGVMFEATFGLENAHLEVKACTLIADYSVVEGSRRAHRLQSTPLSLFFTALREVLQKSHFDQRQVCKMVHLHSSVQED